MTLLEAIEARHSVRKYKEDPIPEDILSIIREKVDEVNREAGLHVQLVTDEPKAFSGVLAGPKSDDLDEKIGYYGERLVLLAQTLGLNTCWAGVSYSKIPGTYELERDEKIGCYIALGYGQTQGSGHKVKDVRDISNSSDITPKWFNKGVDAALLAPTAVNQQKFFLEYLGVKDYSKLPKVAAKPAFSMIGYSRMDLGIVKYHFEIGAGKENFEWA